MAKRNTSDHKCPIESMEGIGTEKRVVGIFCGDATCLRTVVHIWTKRTPSSVLNDEAPVVTLTDATQRKLLVVIRDHTAEISPWPTAPLIWVFPERGPSEPDLALIRQVLRTHNVAKLEVKILLCLPTDVDEAAAATDIDVIAETLRWGVDSDVPLELEAVWLSGSRSPTLEQWLSQLG